MTVENPNYGATFSIITTKMLSLRSFPRRNNLLLVVLPIFFCWFLFHKFILYRVEFYTIPRFTRSNLSRTDWESFFANITSPWHWNCRLFRKQFPVISEPNGDMDLAFTIVVHRDILQIARLLRMIHRVNNYYCIHLDNRSSQIFQDAIDGLTKCFGNNVEVVPQSKRVSVIWGDESVLIPQFICGEQALNSHPTWKYLINLVGQEFPLKTNLEIIAAMKALNGSNLVESFNMTRFKSWINDDKLSLNATFYKGTLYGAYRRDFLEAAILGSHVEPIRRQILMHRKYLHPDELFFPSLAYNSHLGLPGACLRAPALPSEVNLNHPAKFVIWGDYNVPCRTKYVRAVCILGNEHVEWLKSVQHLFANKFYQEYHPQAYDDLEQWYFSKVRAEISTGRHDPNLNLTLYANRTCSRFHL